MWSTAARAPLPISTAEEEEEGVVVVFFLKHIRRVMEVKSDIKSRLDHPSTLLLLILVRIMCPLLSPSGEPLYEPQGKFQRLTQEDYGKDYPSFPSRAASPSAFPFERQDFYGVGSYEARSLIEA